MITRDEGGQTTVRAVRLTSALALDGQLSDGVYSDVPPIADFIQIEPRAGAPFSEKTEMWLLFDESRIYVAFRCWESEPDRMVVNDMRRDSLNLLQNEHVEFMFDTFYDRRNSVYFAVTPVGGRMDGQVTNERQYNADWNPIWEVAVGRFEGGWTVEAAVPFKSLRYRPGHSQTWGFNAGRTSRWRNEISFLTVLPQALGRRGIFQASQAATIVGLEVPAGSRNLELKPYVISDVTTDRRSTPPISNDLGANIGGDIKYGLTQNLTADVTFRTDFAQVEADEQQVNLTRFSLFFPEKRDFFLENLGLFGFGGGVATSAGATANTNVSDTPILFYSRRIGLEGNQQVPLQVGGRLTGQLGRFSVGLLDIRTEDQPLASGATNFGAFRVRRDILRRSSIGAIYTGRSTARGAAADHTYGVDSTLAFFGNLAITSYWAETRNATATDSSYRAHLDYAGDRYGVQLERLVVGDEFNPAVGFVRRDDMRRTFGQFRFSPRPKNSRAIRKIGWMGSLAYIENGEGQLETRLAQGEFNVEFNSSDKVVATLADSYEFVAVPFAIDKATIGRGGYRFRNANVTWMLGQQRTVSGNVSAEYGTFYDGHRMAMSLSRGRIGVTARLSLEPNISLNWLTLAARSFSTNAIGSRVTYTISPMMFVGGLIQYNSTSRSVGANVRLRWEFRSGSELFVVYNEDRATLPGRFPTTNSRAFIVKVNRLFRL